MEQHAAGRRRLSTGDAYLDAGHRALQAAIVYTAETRDDNLALAFGELLDTIERQFRHEEDLMETIDLPSLHCHREQHMRVLGALRLAATGIEAQPWLARHAVDLLADWIELHAQTQDTVLALALELVEGPPGKTS
jgi:hemerythrin